jgi:hypothetical protein
VLRPCQYEKLARGAQDKEHARSQGLDASPAVIGIDIGEAKRCGGFPQRYHCEHIIV